MGAPSKKRKAPPPSTSAEPSSPSTSHSNGIHDDLPLPECKDADVSPSPPSLTLADIRRLESAVLASRAGLNGAVALVEWAESRVQGEVVEGASEVTAAYQALHRILERCVEEETLSLLPSSSSSPSLYSQLQRWLRSLLSRYVDLSLRLLAQPIPSLHLSALHSLLALSKLQCRSAGENAASLLSTGLFASAVSALLTSPAFPQLKEALLPHFLAPHADLQLYTLRILRRVLTSTTPPPPPDAPLYSTALSLLLAISACPPTSVCYAVESVNPAAVSKALNECWLSFLSIRHSVALYKEVLTRMEADILPRLTSPPLLSDFLTDSFAVGGLVSILALSSLFRLIVQHGLDYPHFYHRLYSLCTPAVTSSKHRHRFLALLAQCLTSAYLPSQYVAAYVKRLSRVALCGGADSGVVLLALVFNLVRRHKGLAALVGRRAEVVEQRQAQMASLTDFLVQRQRDLDAQPSAPAASVGADDGLDSEDEATPSAGPTSKAGGLTSQQREEGGKGMERGEGEFTRDPFDALTPELEGTRADESTLWEVRTLTRHYDPTLSGLAALFFAENAPKGDVDVRLYSELSYDALKAKELERRKNQKAPINDVRRTRLFTEGEAFGLTFHV